jgi:hypothetical protein
VRATEQDDLVTPTRQFAFGVLVLGITCLLSNLASFRISPGEAIADRMADPLIGHLNAVGYFAQLGAGLWLAVTLIFDIGVARRWAVAAWAVALCLFLVPLPPLTADLALAPASLVGAGLLTVLGRALLDVTRRPAS